MLFHSLIVDPLAYQDLELEYLHFWRLGLDYSVLNFLSFKPLNKETETQKSWKICQNFNSWMMKFTIVQKSHLALSNLAKLVFWSILSFKKPTSHGVWMPNDCNLNKYVSIVRLNHGHFFFQLKPFFMKSRTVGLGQTNRAGQFWSIWSIFGQDYQYHFGTVSPLSMFSIIQPLLLQKDQHPKYSFGIGVWIWNSKISDTLVCPWSVGQSMKRFFFSILKVWKF